MIVSGFFFYSILLFAPSLRAAKCDIHGGWRMSMQQSMPNVDLTAVYDVNLLSANRFLLRFDVSMTVMGDYDRCVIDGEGTWRMSSDEKTILFLMKDCNVMDPENGGIMETKPNDYTVERECECPPLGIEERVKFQFVKGSNCNEARFDFKGFDGKQPNYDRQPIKTESEIRESWKSMKPLKTGTTTTTIKNTDEL